MRLLAAVALAATVAAAPAFADSPHLLQVTGQGEVRAVPDEAQLSAGIVTTGATAADALAANRSAMNAVFAALKAQGIAERAIQTSGFSVSPQYDPSNDRKGPPRIIGYEVSNQVSVTLTELPKLGATIDALVASGANSLGGVSFTIRDPKPLLREARAAAVKDAIERAQTYAQAAGIALGRVVAIGEGGGAMPHPVYRAMSVMAAAPTPTAPGEESVSASVAMSFEIK
jgi:uncharacterized protein YggE